MALALLAIAFAFLKFFKSMIQSQTWATCLTEACWFPAVYAAYCSGLFSHFNPYYRVPSFSPEKKVVAGFPPAMKPPCVSRMDPSGALR